MKLRYIIFYVEDVAAALEFYTRAFGFSRLFLHEAGDYGEMDTGRTKLAFSARALMRELGKSPAPADADAPSFEIAFETDDVAAALARAVEAGATLRQEAREEPWGQTTAYVSDPDGYLIEICTPVAGGA